MTIWVAAIIFIALAFDFFNGFHDAANSIATVVSTRVLSPQQAVVWAAFFNFAAFLVFGTEVAATIANDVVQPSVFDNAVIFAGLVGAVAWDIITLQTATFPRGMWPLARRASVVSAAAGTRDR